MRRARAFAAAFLAAAISFPLLSAEPAAATPPANGSPLAPLAAAATSTGSGSSATKLTAFGRSDGALHVRGTKPTDRNTTLSAAGTDTSSGSGRVSADALTTAQQALPGGFHTLPVRRLLDTRDGTGAPKGLVKPGSPVTLQVTGREGVPATGVSTVALTVTAVSPTGGGFVVAYASGSPVPTASSLNFAKGQTVPNLVFAQVSDTGKVDLRIGGSGSAYLLADLAGYVDAGAATDAGTLTSVAPFRLLDTRSGWGAPQGAVPGGGTVTVQVTGRGGVPTSGAAAAVVNLTVTEGTASGVLTADSVISGAVSTSNLNWTKGLTRANLALVPLSPSGSIDLRVTSPGTVQLVTDVVGYIREGDAVADGSVVMLPPVRVLDTRTDGGGPVYNHDWATVSFLDDPALPQRPAAAILNVTATRPTGPGFVAALPSGPTLVVGSNNNFDTGGTTPNLVVVPMGDVPAVDLFTVVSGTDGHVDLVADLVGYIIGPPADTTAPAIADVQTQVTGTDSITLSWTNPPDADFAGVTIKRFVEGDPSDDPLVGKTVAETTGTSFTDTGLAPGTRYSYSLWAHDDVPNVDGWGVSATTQPMTFGTPSRIAPYVGSSSGVSCPTTTWCLSVDHSGQALTWNGSTWSAPVAVAAPTDPQRGGFGAVTCTSPSFCVALFENEKIYTYRSGSWSGPTTVASGGAVLPWTDVDCTSTTFCVAVGGPWTTRFNGTTWSAPVKVSGTYSSVDCVSTSFCMAVGSNSSDGTYKSTAARFNGSTWATWSLGTNFAEVACVSTTWCIATTDFLTTRTFNGSSWSTSKSFNGFGAHSLTCRSTTFCLAHGPGGIYRWSGSTWSGPSALSSPANSLVSGEVSCASTSMCVFVDSIGRWSRWNGSTWSGRATVDTTRGGLLEVSCASATLCLAGDERGDAYRWTGSSWSRSPVSLLEMSVSCVPSATWCMTTDSTSTSRLWNGSWGASTSTPAPLHTVSCPRAGWCGGFDWHGRVSIFNGTSWGALATVFSLGGSSAKTYLECVTSSFCLALNESGSAWSVWRGSSWSTPKQLSGASLFQGSLSCASTTMCLLVDGNGKTFRFTGSSWSSAPAVPPGHDIRQLDCWSTTVCAGLDSGGGVVVYNGSGWSAQTASTGLPAVAADGDLRGFACAAGGFCTAVTATAAVTTS